MKSQVIWILLNQWKQMERRKKKWILGLLLSLAGFFVVISMVAIYAAVQLSGRAITWLQQSTPQIEVAKNEVVQSDCWRQMSQLQNPLTWTEAQIIPKLQNSVLVCWREWTGGAATQMQQPPPAQQPEDSESMNI